MSKQKPPENEVPVAEPAPEPPPRRQVSIDDDLVRKARIIAPALGLSVPDYINNRLRPVIDEELPAVLRSLTD